MDLLIRSAIIVDPTSPHNGKQKDILIRDGKIGLIADSLDNPENIEEFSAPNLHVSPGFTDMQANFRDPGHEYKEDLGSGCRAAIRGGFTKVCVQSSTEPVLDHKSGIESISNRSRRLPVDVLPIGALTSNREGKEMAELFDMKRSGAIAFSDDKRPVENPKLFELILEYVKNFDGLVIHFPDTPGLSKNSVMNESDTSVYLGLKGAPAMAEELAIHRDLYILEYTRSRLHYSLISTARSASLIREGKAKGLQLTAAAGAHYLLFDDGVMEGFDSVHKVKPPYRRPEDIEALKSGLKDGTIDVICSDHSPEDVETKRCELEYAAYGIVNIETCFSAARTALKDTLTLTELVEKLAVNPRKILRIPVPSVQENNVAELSFFDPDMEWTYSEKDIVSRSKNSPFPGFTFTGKVLGVFTKSAFHRNPEPSA